MNILDQSIQYIQKQIPENIDNEKIKEVLVFNNNDIMKTITDLWNIEIKQETKKERTKIDELRDICKEMQDEIEKYKKGKS